MRLDDPGSSDNFIDRTGRGGMSLGGMGGGIFALIFQLVASRFGIVGILILGLGYCALTSLGGGGSILGGGSSSSTEPIFVVASRAATALSSSHEGDQMTTPVPPGLVRAALLLTLALPSPLAAVPVPTGGQFQANSHTTSSQSQPEVATDGAGNFIVAWSSGWPGIGTDTSFASVHARRFTSAA